MTGATTQKLKFNQRIAPKAGNHIAAKDVLQRLQKLHEELNALDQDHVDLQSLSSIVKEVVDKNILQHRDPGVKAYAACCITEILRLYAPDAPYDAKKLSEIFNFIFDQFPNLSNQESTYWRQYVHALQMLTDVRSIVLITDVPNCDDLITKCFTVFYDAAQKGFPRIIEPLVGELLTAVIDECEDVPQDVMDLILSQFVKGISPVSSSLASSTPHTTKKGKSKSKTSTEVPEEASILNAAKSPALKLSKVICETCCDKIARKVTQYFSEIIDSNAGPDKTVDDKKALENLNRGHRLVVEIWRNCPDVLSSTLGILDTELVVDDVHIRVLATRTVGQILSITSSNYKFYTENKDIYSKWVNKFHDASPVVREVWADEAVHAMTGLPDPQPIKEAVAGFVNSLVDKDEKVRLTACRTVSRMGAGWIINKIRSTELITNLQALTRDRHLLVRNAAIEVLGELYDGAFWQLYSGDDELDKLLGSIPTILLNLVYINDKQITALVAKILRDNILPFDLSTESRVRRLLIVLSHLDSKAKTAFYKACALQKQLATYMNQMMDICEKLNEEEESNNAELQARFERITKTLEFVCPPDLHVAEAMTKFHQIDNKRLYRLIRHCVSSDSDYELVVKSLKELFARLEESWKSLLPVFQTLMYQCANLFYSRSNIASLLEISGNKTDQLQTISNELIMQISAVQPHVFQSHISDLIQLVTDSKPGTDDMSSSLKALLLFGRQSAGSFLEEAGEDSNRKEGQLSRQKLEQFKTKLQQFALYGTEKEAKHSVKILCLASDKEKLCKDIVEKCFPLDKSEPTFPTKLSALATMFLVIPNLVEEHAGELTNYIIKQVLLRNDTARIEPETENSPSWVEYSALEPECRAKLAGLKLFVNRLRASSKSEAAEQLAPSVFKLLISLIGNGGEIVPVRFGKTPNHYQSQLRLSAGLQVLKLAKYEVYDKMIRPQHLARLIFIIQDECPEVRTRFIKQFERYINNGLITERYFPVVFFAAHEPVPDLRREVKTWIQSHRLRLTPEKQTGIEYAFARLIHMIAHHNDFIENMQDYSQAKADGKIDDESQEKLFNAYTLSLEYIVFYLEVIANSSNVSLLFYLSQRIKQYRDGIIDDTEDDKAANIYRISDLAQMSIKNLQEVKGWSLETWPGKVNLFPDIFTPISSSQEAQKIAKTVFIHQEILDRLAVFVRERVSSMAHRRTFDQRRAPGTALEEVKNKVQRQEKRKKRQKARSAERKTKKAAKIDKTETSLPQRTSRRARNEVSYKEMPEDDSSASEETAESSQDATE